MPVLPAIIITHRRRLHRGEIQVLSDQQFEQFRATERVRIETRLAAAIHSQPLSWKLQNLKHPDLWAEQRNRLSYAAIYIRKIMIHRGSRSWVFNVLSKWATQNVCGNFRATPGCQRGLSVCMKCCIHSFGGGGRGKQKPSEDASR